MLLECIRELIKDGPILDPGMHPELLQILVQTQNLNHVWVQALTRIGIRIEPEWNSENNQNWTQDHTKCHYIPRPEMNTFPDTNGFVPRPKSNSGKIKTQLFAYQNEFISGS